MTESNGIHSQDYWDIVLNQLKKRVSVIFSLTVLVFLYAVAIYAPLIANNRPLYFRGVDFAAYKKAQRELSLGATSLAERLEARCSPDRIERRLLGHGGHGVVAAAHRAFQQLEAAFDLSRSEEEERVHE